MELELDLLNIGRLVDLSADLLHVRVNSQNLESFPFGPISVLSRRGAVRTALEHFSCMLAHQKVVCDWVLVIRLNVELFPEQFVAIVNSSSAVRQNLKVSLIF